MLRINESNYNLVCGGKNPNQQRNALVRILYRNIIGVNIQQLVALGYSRNYLDQIFTVQGNQISGFRNLTVSQINSLGDIMAHAERAHIVIIPSPKKAQ